MNGIHGIPLRATRIVIPCLALVPGVAACAGSDTVKEVKSGNLVVLEDGTTVRYAGVAAPGPDDPGCEPALMRNRQLVQARRVTLIGPEENDAGELVAFVYTPIQEGGKTRQLFVQGELCLFGYVRATPPPGHPSHPELFQDLANLEAMAREARRGIWAEE